ncbi:MAG: Flp family type IVb pilin [Planctomycetaceae bacterium]|nr:Flp family type IVb pilin [Planctomycetaceae bacterium]
MRTALQNFLREEGGTTAVEYAVMLAMVLLVMIGTIATFGSQTGGLWGNTNTRLSEAGFGS